MDRLRGPPSRRSSSRSSPSPPARRPRPAAPAPGAAARPVAAPAPDRPRRPPLAEPRPDARRSSSRSTASATPATSPSTAPPAPGPRRGIAVYAPDQRGFGGNDSRKRWPGDDALVADAVALSRWVRAEDPGVPLVVVGHSMGGGVALAAAADGLDADGLVLAGPAIAGGDALNPLLRAARLDLRRRRCPRRAGPGRASSPSTRPTTPTPSPASLADPRHFADPSSRELFGLVRLMDRAAAAAPSVADADPRRSSAPTTRCSAPTRSPRSHAASPASSPSSTTPTAGTGSSATARRRGSGTTSPPSSSRSRRRRRDGRTRQAPLIRG